MLLIFGCDCIISLSRVAVLNVPLVTLSISSSSPLAKKIKEIWHSKFGKLKQISVNTIINQICLNVDSTVPFLCNKNDNKYIYEIDTYNNGPSESILNKIV